MWGESAEYGADDETHEEVDPGPEPPLQIASLYYPDATVLIEDVANASAPAAAGRSRAALVRAEYDAETRTSLVELHLAGRVGIARAEGSALESGVDATLAALRELGINVPYSLVSVSNMITVRSWPVVVVLRSLINGSDRFGVAQSDSDVTAAVKATLSAVNRLPRDEAARDSSN